LWRIDNLERREVFMVGLGYSQTIRRADLNWTTQLIDDLTSGRERAQS
jgi:hypothetical protein